jgi:putative Mg2+ transporter-C (MgtC) family protein
MDMAIHIRAFSFGCPYDRLCLEDLIKILVAIVSGGIIGFERELHSKAAGLRTITLITVGAAMFSILSSKHTDTATSRVAANIVKGVGFVGVGVSQFAEGKGKGLTNASSDWWRRRRGWQSGWASTAPAWRPPCWLLSSSTCSPGWWLAGYHGRESRSYEITFSKRPGKDKELEEIFGEYRMVVRSHRPMRQQSCRRDTWEIDGRAGNQHALAEKSLADEESSELRY